MYCVVQRFEEENIKNISIMTNPWLSVNLNMRTTLIFNAVHTFYYSNTREH